MEEKESTPKYHVYDRQTGERANKTEYKSRAGARRAVDKFIMIMVDTDIMKTSRNIYGWRQGWYGWRRRHESN
jgi:hypothetical protein